MIVNGNRVVMEALGVRTLSDLVKTYGFQQASVAVEWNGTLPDRSEWERITLSDEDRIELIGFVGGG